MVVVQSYSSLYEKHGLICTNGVVQVEPDRPFRLLVANFRKYPIRGQKIQVVAELIPHPRAVLESKTTIGDVLRIQEREEEIIPNYTPPPNGETRCEPSDQGCEDQPGGRSTGLSASASTRPQRMVELPPPDAEELNPSHGPDRLRERFRRILKKYSRMWEGTLGEINTTVHRVELIPGTRPTAQAPYRAGPKAREIEDAEVQKMLEAGVIEPAQSEWASPVLLVPKPDGSMRFCVDYRRFYAVTVKDTYPLPRMDECLDSLGGTKVLPRSTRFRDIGRCQSRNATATRLYFHATQAYTDFQECPSALRTRRRRFR